MEELHVRLCANRSYNELTRQKLTSENRFGFSFHAIILVDMIENGLMVVDCASSDVPVRDCDRKRRRSFGNLAHFCHFLRPSTSHSHKPFLSFHLYYI